MSDIEIIPSGYGRQRYWPASEKLHIVEETLSGDESISMVARRNGVAPNLLYRWRRLMLEGGSIAVMGDDSVTGNKTVRQMEGRIRELERLLGCKTMENETLKETRIFAQKLNLKPGFTPVASPESNGTSEAFVKTMKRDYVKVCPLPDAETALKLIDGWFEDDNENHPHSVLKMRSPREFDLPPRSAPAPMREFDAGLRPSVQAGA